MASKVGFITNKAIGAATELGKAALSALYPNDFEAYLMAIELTDSNDKTIDYFTFPVMPEGITKREPKRTSVKKTSAGTTVLTSPSFVPQEINIQGDFGRYFKILLGTGVAYADSADKSKYSVKAGKYELSQINEGTNSKRGLMLSFPSFDMNVKNGYGAIKILKAIISKSNGLDSTGKPFKLYFYNMAFGESYLVTVPQGGLTVSQQQGKNMIWRYSLTLTILAPLSQSKGESKGNLVSSLTSAAIQKGVNDIVKSVTNILT